MNKKEFDEMQLEFAEYIYNYKKQLKDAYILDLRYISHYYPLLTEIDRLNAQINIYKQAIELHDKINKSELFDKLDEAWLNYLEYNSKLNQRYEYSTKQMIHLNSLNQNDILMVEELYQQFIYDYHPYVRVKLAKDAKNIIEQIKRYYFENNKNGIIEMIELNKKLLSSLPIATEEYDMVAEFYYELKKKINSEYNKHINQYPYTKRDVFADTMSIAREEGELQIQKKQLAKEFSAISADFESIFGQVYSFKDKI